jgi:hypothetical protein
MLQHHQNAPPNCGARP